MNSTEALYTLVKNSIDTALPFRKEAQAPKGSQIHSNVAQKYVTLCEKNGIMPDIIGYADIATGYKSKMGNFLEIGFSAVANVLISNKGQHFIGKRIESQILAYRKLINSTIPTIGAPEAIPSVEEAAVSLHSLFHVNKNWAIRMITPVSSISNGKGVVIHKYPKVSLPDSITVFHKEDGTTMVKIGEAKLSGQLDSKNLPKNIDELMDKGPFDDIENTVVKRAILLTGTRCANGKYPMASAWINEINRRGIALPVLCNEYAFEWATGEHITTEQYFGSIIVAIEDLAAERCFMQLHS